MTHKFYTRLIKPISKDSDQAEREIVLSYLLVGVFGLAVIALIDTILAPIISSETPHPYRILNISGTIIFIVALYVTARYKQQHRPVAIVLSVLIALIACLMVYHWGLLLPTGILLCGLSVVVAGVLVSARSALYAASAITIALVIMQHGKTAQYIQPDLSWMRISSTPGDVIGFAAIFFTIALVSWLFNRQMEASLRRARRSEKALQRERDQLEMKVEKRARELEAAQLDKMQQLYRFAELGQLSTALFHDLSNHLSTVNVDIEGLADNERPEITRRIQHNVGHINSIVRRVRQQIGGKNSIEIFDVLHEINEVVKILTPTAEQARVHIDAGVDESIKPSLSHKGDITRFRQVILNLISNGLEAYPKPTRRSKPTSRIVRVEVRRRNSTLTIGVTDYGRGIRPSDQARIFEPFYTTKKEGVGIGLFIVRQVVEQDLGGELTMTSSKQQGTTFTISLPKSYYAKNQ